MLNCATVECNRLLLTVCVGATSVEVIIAVDAVVQVVDFDKADQVNVFVALRRYMALLRLLLKLALIYHANLGLVARGSLVSTASCSNLDVLTFKLTQLINAALSRAEWEVGRRPGSAVDGHSGSAQRQTVPFVINHILFRGIVARVLES